MAFAHPHHGGPSCNRYHYKLGLPHRVRLTNLSPEKAHQLKRYLEREDHKWRKDRVKNYLLQRIKASDQRNKLHNQSAEKLIDETVDKIVEDESFVFQGKHLISSGSKELLFQLEKKLLSALSSLPASQRRSRSSSIIPPLDTNEIGSNNPGNNHGGKGTQPPLDKIDTWQLINAYESFAEQEKMKQEKMKEVQRKASYRMELERQKQKLEDEKKKITEENAKIREQQQRQYEEWKTEQERIRRSIQEKHEVEKVKYVEVIAEKERVKQREREVKLAHEREQIQSYQRAQREDQERIRWLKAQERHRQFLIQEENKKEKERRKIRDEAIAQEDLRIMQEYKAKLDREEEERRNAFSQRMSKLKNLGEKWASEGAGKKQEVIQLQQEKAIMEAAMKKEQQDAERERQDKFNKLMAKKRMAEENLKMSEMHMMEAKQQKEMEKEEIERLRQQEREKKARELQDRMEERARQRDYSNFLKNQIHNNYRSRNEPDISDKEKLLNRHILSAAESNTQFVDFCQKKLLPALEGSSRRKNSYRPPL